MLPKSQRLNLKLKFKWVASGKSLTSPNFKLFYRLGENTNPLIGVSIVSAQFKKAVLRNKAKRICFDLAGALYDRLPNNINLVIMPRTQILQKSKESLEEEFKDAVSGIKIN